MPDTTPTEDHGTAEFDAVVSFLEARFKGNAAKYPDSFAMKLNNAAAVELAEVLFPVDTVKCAQSKIRAARRSAPSTGTEFAN